MRHHHLAKQIPTIFRISSSNGSSIAKLIPVYNAELEKLTRSFGADLAPASKIWGPSVPKRLTRSISASAAIANQKSQNIRHYQNAQNRNVN